MKLRIITDTASDITQNSRPDLTVLPMAIRFSETEYLDGVTLSHRQFYEKLIESDTLPTTSQISPYTFECAFKKVEEADETAVVITMSSKLSGTYQSALLAAESHPGRIFVVDSENVCAGQKILVEYALRLCDSGSDAETIAQELEEKKKSVRLIALLDTLEYLRRGGRISNVSGIVGGMLSIKPVISIEHGEVCILGKARGSKNGNNLLTEHIRKAGGVDFSMPFALAYTGLDDSLLQKYICDNEALWKPAARDLPIGTVGGTIGTHAGPGAIVAAFFAGDGM